MIVADARPAGVGDQIVVVDAVGDGSLALSAGEGGCCSSTSIGSSLVRYSLAEVVDRVGGHVVDIGLHDDGIESPVDAPLTSAAPTAHARSPGAPSAPVLTTRVSVRPCLSQTLTGTFLATQPMATLSFRSFLAAGTAATSRPRRLMGPHS